MKKNVSLCMMLMLSKDRKTITLCTLKTADFVDFYFKKSAKLSIC